MNYEESKYNISTTNITGVVTNIKKDKEKVTKLLKSIDKALRALAKETEAEHISCYMLNDNVSINDYTNTKKPKFNYYHNKKHGEDIEIYE